MSFSNQKSDSSMKLKSQNLRNAKRQTNQMADETRKMEVRLQELKLAMAHEKEERERQGSGGFWRSGQAGGLNNYSGDGRKSAKENREKGSKGRKIKIAVLKDEPIVPPERSKQPGTYGGIANRKISPRDKKIKGPKCGQCEAKAAHVNCLECGEDYCAACFASFHLKGALKKHRSVPVGTQGGARQSLTPRKPQNGDVVLHMSPDNATKERSSPVGSSRPFDGPSLLDGEYSEYDAHADFQNALAEWRGEKAAKKQTDKKVTFGTDTVPAKAPKSQMEFGTDTGTDNILQEKKVEINFNQSGMTYAERLLLKQHRRNDTVGGLHSGLPADVKPLVESPRDEDDGSFNTRIEFSSVYETASQSCLCRQNEYRGGRVDFDSLRQVAAGDNDHLDYDRPESRVQITEIDTNKVKSASLRGIPQTSMFHVHEEDDKLDLPLRSPTPVKSPTPPPTPNAPKGPRRAFATPSPRTRRRMAANLTPEPKELPSKTPIRGFNDPTPVTSPRHQPKINKPKAKVREMKPKEEEQKPIDSEELVKQLLKEQKELKAKDRKTPRPNSANKSRPQSGRSQSRAQSRAESTRPKSRTWMYGEGTLTKEPSEDLRAIASLARKTVDGITQNVLAREGFITKGPSKELREISMLAHNTMGSIMKNVGLEGMVAGTTSLTDFFRMGVAPPPPEERALTPSRDRQKNDDKYKISNKLYQMGPRSWRPDSSLGNNVDDSAVAGFMEDDGVREGVREFYNHSDIPVDDGRSGSVLSYSLSGNSTGPEPSLNGPKVSKSSQLGAKSRTSTTVKSASRSQGIRSSRAKTPISARPQSRAVVMDGEDLSRYDEVGKKQRDDSDDTAALDQLEWELASQEGRITADGQVSRMSMVEGGELSDEEMELGIERDDGRGSGLTTPDPDQGFVQQQLLRASQLMDDFEEMEAMIQDESAVKALD